MRHSFNKKLSIGLLVAFFYLQIFGLMPGQCNALYAVVQFDCSDRLDQAEEHYYDGQFDEAIIIVNQCLQDKTIALKEQIRSYTILARIYLAKDDIEKTKQNVRIILRLEPAYQPTIEQETPKYINLVTEVRKEQEQLAVAETSTGISSWLLIGAGSVAAVAIIAIAVSGGSDEKGTQDTSLPKPPDFPE
jgi:tetratricopeptide (TPR) repeat protein